MQWIMVLIIIKGGTEFYNLWNLLSYSFPSTIFPFLFVINQMRLTKEYITNNSNEKFVADMLCLLIINFGYFDQHFSSSFHYIKVLQLITVYSSSLYVLMHIASESATPQPIFLAMYHGFFLVLCIGAFMKSEYLSPKISYSLSLKST